MILEEFLGEAQRDFTVKPERVLWARKYFMTILSGTKLVALVRPQGSDHGRSLTNSLEVLSAL